MPLPLLNNRCDYFTFAAAFTAVRKNCFGVCITDMDLVLNLPPGFSMKVVNYAAVGHRSAELEFITLDSRFRALFGFALSDLAVCTKFVSEGTGLVYPTDDAFVLETRFLNIGDPDFPEGESVTVGQAKAYMARKLKLVTEAALYMIYMPDSL